MPRHITIFLGFIAFVIGGFWFLTRTTTDTTSAFSLLNLLRSTVAQVNGVPRGQVIPDVDRRQISNVKLSYAKIDPATGFRAVATLPATMRVTQEERTLVLDRLTQCVKKITGLYGLPVPKRFELIFFDPATGERLEPFPHSGQLFLNIAVLRPDTYFQGLRNRFDCIGSNHEMAHAIGPFDHGILEEGYATFTNRMFTTGVGAVCAEAGYCERISNDPAFGSYASQSYLLPYSLVHRTKVNDTIYSHAKYSTGECAWSYLYSKLGRRKFQEIFDRFEKDDCGWGNCITDFILPVLGEREMRIFEDKFDLHRTDQNKSSDFQQPIRPVENCSEVQEAPWSRPPAVSPRDRLPRPITQTPIEPHYEVPDVEN